MGLTVMAQVIKRRMLHSERRPSGDLVTTMRSHMPDCAPGDLAFLDPSRPLDVQIRPMLDGERPRGSAKSHPPGATWLVWTSPLNVQLRALVTMPPPYRKNIASNVARAIRRVAQVSPEHAKAFEMALSGIDPFTNRAIAPRETA